MFTNPIKHTRLTSMEELLKFSYRTNIFSEHKLTVSQNNGQIAFSDEQGLVYVTPYRSEIHSILTEAGYSKASMHVPFSNSENRPDAYQWLVKIAEEENWAVTHEEAFKVATEKGIQPVRVNGKYQIKEISDYDDTDTHIRYTSLTTKFLFNNSKDNIGTYIIVDEKTLVICDEYGRTFLLKAKTVVNDIVNALIDAGYTRTANPEWYVKHYEPEDSFI